ncbi:WxL protein peptidoglycan domain-containing protein [Agromyces atrinae]|nr:DUF916 domain-containing protein [Agromyces atrinae]
MFLLHSRRGHAFAAFLGGLVLTAALASPALAAGSDEPAGVRWSVTPADASASDARTTIEHTLDPGESRDDYIAVRNVSDQPVVFELTAADGFSTRTGRFDILPAGEESVDAGTWITLPDTVTVEGGATAIVPFTIAVPRLAQPGDHAAGITASVFSVQSAEDGTAIGVDSRVGVRVLTRVSGEVRPEVAIEALRGEYITAWNPLRPGTVNVTFDVVNLGNTIVRASGAVDVGGQSMTYPQPGSDVPELLPGETRTMTVAVNDVWPLFVVAAHATVGATAVTLDGTRSDLSPVTAEASVAAVPWPQLIVLLGAALLLGAVISARRRSRRRVAQLVEEAREHGRQDALSLPTNTH